MLGVTEFQHVQTLPIDAGSRTGKHRDKSPSELPLPTGHSRFCGLLVEDGLPGSAARRLLPR
jgi:hypothetical protein